jgi:hypothetical protein
LTVYAAIVFTILMLMAWLFGAIAAMFNPTSEEWRDDEV